MGKMTLYTGFFLLLATCYCVLSRYLFRAEPVAGTVSSVPGIQETALAVTVGPRPYVYMASIANQGRTFHTNTLTKMHIISEIQFLSVMFQWNKDFLTCECQVLLDIMDHLNDTRSLAELLPIVY